MTRAWWNAPYLLAADATRSRSPSIVAGLSPITTPIQWLGGSPLLAYNLVLIASTWWSGLATHALVRRLDRLRCRRPIARGMAFAFAPYRTSQLAHLQLYACWWLPLAFLSLHAYYDDGRDAMAGPGRSGAGCCRG